MTKQELFDKVFDDFKAEVKKTEALSEEAKKREDFDCASKNCSYILGMIYILDKFNAYISEDHINDLPVNK